MNTPLNPVARLAELSLEPFSRGEHWASQDAPLGERLALTQLGACYIEVQPGRSSCPCHVHHNEDELFVILEGEAEYRFGEHRYAVRAGDVLGAPRGGPEYAHKLTNTGSGTLRYLAVSSKADTEICEYPDSGKFAVFGRRKIGSRDRLRFIGREADGLDYWDGEPGA
ncbi:cupin domain-containing protein [Mangrovimicrobium sediminis]|uniref:Cupin domain-containing protein n=1 Tax=Mangrovimicrobium sediminis TaxID=2562682 RepID=A0A4Z0M532_9GAMM|nr:cupin domain-containing protein [Haliea sp. SAOS-164]TGD74609.1 cupin domain-containing protein [Haliea sp. SAOS-164]